MIKLGLIGSGRWGKRYIHTINQINDIDLVHLYSSKDEAKYLTNGDCLISRDWKQLVNNTELDGIIVASPPSSHFEISMSAIKNKIPTLIEKPITLDLQEAIEIKEYSVDNNVLVLVGHTHLYSEAFRLMKSIGENLGKLLNVESIGCGWGPFRKDTPMLWDWAPHDIAMCLELFKINPVTVRCKTVNVIKTPDFYGEEKMIHLIFPDHTFAHITVSNINKIKKRYIRATYESGILVYDDQSIDKLKLIKSKFNKEENICKLSGIYPLDCLVREFSGAIILKKTNDPGLNIGIEVVKILKQCDENNISISM